MFDLSWSELLLVGAIALVVIGPRELPRVLRTIGQTLAKLRRMAGDFQSQFNAAMREAELDEIRNAVNDVQTAANRAVGSSSSARFDPLRTVRDELRDAIEKPPAAGAPPPGPATPVDLPPPAPALPVSPGVQAAKPQLSKEAATGAPAGKPADKSKPASKPAGKPGRVIVAAPREAVKPLARPARGTSRLYKKVRFSALPVRSRPARSRPLGDGEGDA
ncbi:Sec-independent protein translocase protein TatB [Pseudochelatococcus sp. B33]